MTHTDDTVSITALSCYAYCSSLWAGRSGDRIPVGGEVFRTRPDRP